MRVSLSPPPTLRQKHKCARATMCLCAHTLKRAHTDDCVCNFSFTTPWPAPLVPQKTRGVRSIVASRWTRVCVYIIMANGCKGFYAESGASRFARLRPFWLSTPAPLLRLTRAAFAASTHSVVINYARPKPTLARLCSYECIRTRYYIP